MIGLMFCGALGLWFVFAIYLGRKLPIWCNLKPVWSFLFVPLVFFAPVLDEFIGRWQFNQLCEKEAVIWLSPNWKGVEAVRNVSSSFFSNASWTFIPIQIQPLEYVDASTGQPFMSYSALHTKGGLLLGTFGLGLGGATSCWPKKEIEIRKMVDIDKLIKKGETK